MDNMTFIEALAHQMRGATLMFFIVLCVTFFKSRKLNWMMKILFISVVCLAIGFLKDSVFLIESAEYNTTINGIVNIFDYSVMLVVCNFFHEAVKPESTKKLQAWAGPVIELLLIPAYIAFPSKTLLLAAGAIALAIAVLSVIYVLIYAVRHRRYVSDNYSYSDNISVQWVAISGILYTVGIFSYLILFRDATWFGEVIYCLLCILIFTYLSNSAKKHKIIRMEESEDTKQELPDIEKTSRNDISKEEQESEMLSYIKGMIEPKLRHCMEEEKIYLDPKLSLKNVAVALGSNTKYLSLYINRCIGCTFNDYINSFRVQESCRILEQMTISDRLNMTEVAEKSGFNSVSSFNRYFRTKMGVTPKEYYKECKHQKASETRS